MARLISALPDWILWLCQAAYVFGVGYGALLLVGVAFVARSRLRMARDLLVAAALATVSAIALTGVADGDWPEIALTQLGERRPISLASTARRPTKSPG